MLTSIEWDVAPRCTWSPCGPFATDEDAHAYSISPWIHGVRASGNQHEHLWRYMVINRFGTPFLRCAHRVGLSCTFPSHGGNATRKSDTRAGARHCAKPAFADVQFTAKERKKQRTKRKEQKKQTNGWDGTRTRGPSHLSEMT